MNSFVPIMMLAVMFFLAGGVVSFARAKRPLPAAVLGLGAVLAGTAAWLWW